MVDALLIQGSDGGPGRGRPQDEIRQRPDERVEPVRALAARGDAGVERLTISRYPLGTLYEAAWEGGDLDAQWARLAEIVAERDPARIAVNVSDLWPVADGLSHGLHTKLTE
ncbi:MAG: hypothetical protein AAGJ87_15870, partial [Pseudomonadota bacterium]